LLRPLQDGEPFIILPFAWCPSDAIQERSKRDRVPYDVWHRKGYIEATPGTVVDYGYILKRIDELAKTIDSEGDSF
jgi:phage terminase large subunit-like protein